MLALIAAAALWGSIGPVARVALGGGMTPLELAFWRALFGGACFAAYALARRAQPVPRADLPAVVGFALVGVTFYYLAFLQAVNTGGAALAVILVFTAPAWVALFAALWLRERMTAPKLLAIALTMAGIGTMATLGGGTIVVSPAALAWGLSAGVAAATYYLFGRHYFRRHDPAVLFAYILPLGALPLGFAASGSGHPPATWLAIGYLAVVPTFVGYRLYAFGLQRVEATRAATLGTIEPVVAATLAWVMWGESLGPGGYAGAALVIVGVGLSARQSAGA